MQKTSVTSLGLEDPREEQMATHSSTLAWEIPWAPLSMGSQKVRHGIATKQQQELACDA